VSSPIPGWGQRLDAVRDELAGRADTLAGLLTSADPEAGERWTGEQVLAHIDELLGYWSDEARRVLQGPDGAVEFGRGKKDPGRLRAVELGRARDGEPLLAELLQNLAGTRAWIGGLVEEDLVVVGVHFRRGRMTVGEIVETYVVAHVEEHLEQLRGAEAGTR
jgi:hypothetical protein